MKKRLLFAALAMVTSLGSFAYEMDDYIYTANGRVKVVGENLVTNGSFADGFDGWTNDDPATFTIATGEGPNGEDVLKSTGRTPDVAFTRVWDGGKFYSGGLYVISFDIKSPDGVGTTSIGETVGNDYVDFFMNTTGSTTRTASTDDEPVVGVAKASDYTNNWSTVAFTFEYEDGYMLVMHLEKLLANMMITNIGIYEVEEVSDDRIATKKIEFAKLLLEDANFNTEEAASAKQSLTSLISQIEGWMADGTWDDPETAESRLGLLDTRLNNYLDVTSLNVNDYLNGIDFPNLVKWNNGDTNTSGQYKNMVLDGGRWAHRESSDDYPDLFDYVNAAIQGSYELGDHRMTFVNDYFPSGKYYIEAEVRVADCPSNAWTFNFTQTRDNAQLFVGDGVYQIGEIAAGKDTKRVYMVGEVAEGQAFKAGVFFPSVGTSGAVFVKNVTIRSFNLDIAADIERKEKWNAFVAQWNAATNNRNTVIALQADADYPWAKDSLQKALDAWDPFYNDVIAKGWVAEDGTDAGVATNEELENWASYQGGEIPEDGKATYQVVRGYQYAINYVKAENQIIADVYATIAQAETTYADPLYAGGDHATFQAAIDAAKAQLATLLATTTDDTREADEVTLQNLIETLLQAEQAFKDGGALKPFVTFDFSNPFQENQETFTHYTTGNPGVMDFGTCVQYDDATGTYTNNDQIVFALGWNETHPEVLRVGNNNATVAFSEDQIPGEGEAIRAEFDVWLGNLSGRFFRVELQNAAGERVAGFNINRYNGTSEYNDFAVEGIEGGMDLLGYATGVGSSSASNDAICTDNNKSHFTLTVDYKAGAVKGTLQNPQKGTSEGKWMPFNAAATDYVVTKFVVGSNYNNADRRCWFDNLDLYKYTSTEEGPLFTGIESTVAAKAAAPAGIYSLTGVKMSGDAKSLKPGLYIINGKKYLVK